MEGVDQVSVQALPEAEARLLHGLESSWKRRGVEGRIQGKTYSPLHEPDVRCQSSDAPAKPAYSRPDQLQAASAPVHGS